MATDPTLLEDVVSHLAGMERGSASEGERRAAEWLAARLRELGCRVEVEEERAHGGYWWPLGLLTGGAGLAGLAALRGGRRRRALAALVGGAAAAGVADDIGGGRLWFRRPLAHRPTWNVVAETGDLDAERTLVLVAHHDAAHSGLVFHPGIPDLAAKWFPGLIERSNTSPPLMWTVFGGPALVALGALTGRRRLLRAGTIVSLGSAAAFADIGARGVVPGANDNATGVATLVGVADQLGRDPVEGLRVLLVSTGAEEGFMEGMRAFAARHFGRLPRERTHVVCIDTVGSPELTLVESEGMLLMRDYDPAFKDLIATCAGDARVELRRGLRFSFATDGLIALKAGYTSALLASVNRFKAPTNYHWPTDTPDRVDFGTVTGAVTLCTALARRLAAQPAVGGPVAA